MNAIRFALRSSLVAACLALPCRALAAHGQESPAPPDLGKLPLAFEENRGQAPGRFDFVARASGGSLALSAQEVLFVPAVGTDDGSQVPAITMCFEGSDPRARVVALEPLPGTVTRLIGRDPSGWIRNTPTHARVRYGNVWPGIDIVHSGEGLSWRYDFVLAPGADPRAIRLAIGGSDLIAVGTDGALVLETCAGTLRQKRPTIYQESGEGVVELEGGFEILGERTVGFAVRGFDATRPLVIDPSVTFEALFAGGSAIPRAVQPDGSSGCWVLGEADHFFPFSGFEFGPRGSTDLFLLHFDWMGDVVSTLLIGGSGRDEAGGLAVVNGWVYVAGITFSDDFPVTPGAFQPTHSEGSDMDDFVMKIDPALPDLLFSSYLGGSGEEVVGGIAVDPASEEVVLVGGTSSLDFPVVDGPQTQLQGERDGFVARIRADGSALVWSTFDGGAGSDWATAVALDAQGSAVVVGSSDLVSSYELFLHVYSPVCTMSPVFAHTVTDFPVYPVAVAVTPAGSYALCGYTDSVQLPRVSALQPSPAGRADAFVMVFDPSVGGLTFATYWGGSGEDVAHGLVAEGNKISLLLTTESPNIDLLNPVSRLHPGDQSAYVAQFTLEGAATLDWATYLPGGDHESAHAMSSDGVGRLVVVGVTADLRSGPDQPADWSVDFVDTPDSFRTSVTFLSADLEPGAGDFGFGLEVDGATYNVPYEFFVYRKHGNTDAVDVAYSVYENQLVFPALSGVISFDSGVQMGRGLITFPLPPTGPNGSCTIVLSTRGGGGEAALSPIRTVTLHRQGGGGNSDDAHDCPYKSVFGSVDPSGGLDGLRAFRDRVLAKTPPGRWFVREYYRAGPKIVRWLEAHPWARLPARAVLFPVALAFGHPAMALLLFLSFAAAIAARKRLASLGADINFSIRTVRLVPAMT